MQFASPLVRGTLVSRYKRFLADVMLDDGRAVTAHVANPGAMLGLRDPGATVWLEPVTDPRRTLPFAWRITELPGGGFAGIDASLANRLVAEALAAGRIAALSGYPNVRPEVRYGEGSRVDFLLTADDRPPAWVEVKNVHFSRVSGVAEFPDSATARGARHLRELAIRAAAGDRAVLLYVVQRTDCSRFRLAVDLDPAYAAAAAAARAAGVESLALAAAIDPGGITLAEPIAIAP